MADFDLAIIGGGLNGVSIARDAAGRGLRVILMEQADLAGGATAASPALSQGNFIDLERSSFASVRAALKERETGLRAAPHLVRPTRYVVPVHPEERPPAMLRAGAFVYDRLAVAGSHAPSQMLDLTHHEMGNPLKRSAGAAVEISDAVVNDTRLAVLTAVDAAARGAFIKTGARCARADRSDEWRIAAINRGQREMFTARALVNAAGAWCATVAETILHLPPPAMAFTRSTYIVVSRLFDHDNVYLLQNDDRRIITAAPFERDFTLIGTCLQSFDGDPATVAATSADVSYLCKAAGRYFREKIDPADVARAVSGVYVTHDRGGNKRASRSGFMRLDRKFGEAPLLTVFGGETTMARRVAELAMKELSSFFALSPDWTSHEPLPGGDFPWCEFGDQVEKHKQRWPFLNPNNAQRLTAAYGTTLEKVLGDASIASDLGPAFGPELTGAEVRYLMRHEWARFADDVLWRRSKLGLSMSAKDREALEGFMVQQTQGG